MTPKAVPMVCLVCKHTPGNYFGRLVFPDELLPEAPVPTCPNHEGKEMTYPLTPVLKNGITDMSSSDRSVPLSSGKPNEGHVNGVPPVTLPAARLAVLAHVRKLVRQDGRAR